MPIKWNIATDAMKARGLMDQISAEYKSLIADGTEHLTDVKGIRSQVGEMKTDLYAAANVMGNGSANGGVDSQPSPVVSQNIQAGVGDLNEPKPAPALPQATPASPPAVGQASTFPDQTP